MRNRQGPLIANAHPNGPPINCNPVNDSSLKGYWKLDEASGNATDAKGANTLTDNGGISTQSGQVGTSRDFSAASSQYFSIADNAALSAGDIDITVAAWVRYGGTVTAGQYPGILSKWGGGQNEYVLYLNGDTGRFEFDVSANGSAQTGVQATTFGAIASSTWYYVLAWHDATANTLNIQVNGGTVDSVSYSSGIFDGTAAFTLGSIGVGFFWTGQIDEAQVTKRVLTSDERYSLSTACRPSGL